MPELGTRSDHWDGAHSGRTGTGALNSEGIQCGQQETLSRRQGHRQQVALEKGPEEYCDPIGK